MVDQSLETDLRYLSKNLVRSSVRWSEYKSYHPWDECTTGIVERREVAVRYRETVPQTLIDDWSIASLQ
jgi:hypothetical protein